MAANLSSAVQNRAPSTAVVEAVADREGVDPTELEVPLYEVVEPEALDDLASGTAQTDENPVTVEFTYYGYDVEVSSEGGVRLSETV